MAMKSFQQLVVEGHEPSVKINELMQTDAYTSLQITAESRAVKETVTKYFLNLFGNGPAEGTVQNMNTDRGGHGIRSEICDGKLETKRRANRTGSSRCGVERTLSA